MSQRQESVYLEGMCKRGVLFSQPQWALSLTTVFILALHYQISTSQKTLWNDVINCGGKRQIPQKKADEAFGFNNKVGCLYRLLILLHLELECPCRTCQESLGWSSRNLSSCYSAAGLPSCKATSLASFRLANLTECYGSSILPSLWSKSMNGAYQC